MRVYELAKEFNLKGPDLVNKMRKDWGFSVRSYMEELSPEIEKSIRKKIEKERAPKKEVVKKRKTTTRKTTTRKTAVKKTVTQKTAVKKTAVKKTAIKKTETTPQEEKPLEEKPAPSPRIIRRKAVEVQPVAQKIKQEKLGTPVAKESSEPATEKEPSSFKEDLRALKVKEEEELEEKKKAKKGAEKEEAIKKFRASDFRKREVIFQPKKKRTILTGDSKKTKITKPKEHKRVIKFYNSLSVQELSHQMGVKVRVLIDKLKKEGMAAEPQTLLDFDVTLLVASDFGFEVKNTKKSFNEVVQELKFGDFKTPPQARPPIVTIMGHVDHGKTTLLDFLRKTRVVSQEAGGITQHIGAYSVPVGKSHITFIDTPGHEAFAQMRSRGTQLTNIVIIVVAADDGVKPQTIEAIKHAQSAKVPILVAINKIDKPEAQVDKIKQQMSEQGLVSEEWGGETIFVPISALKGTGIKELLEQILLIAEIQEIKAHPRQSAEGIVIESRMEKGRGWVATLIVQNGTLKKSQFIMTPSLVGRVRQMTNDQGQSVSEVAPGFPVEISGFEKTPQVGEKFYAIKDEKRGREFISQKEVKKEETPSQKSIEDLLTLQSQNLKELVLLIKADVAGSLEAIKGSISQLKSEDIKINIVHSGLGGVTENDVLFAASSGGEIFGFNVRPDSKTEKLAKDHQVSIWTYNVIYELLDGIKQRALGKLDPHVEEEVTGRAEVREIFNISKVGVISGCKVTQGQVGRDHLARLIRDGRVIFDGQIKSLKRFKDDVKEVSENFECGIGLDSFNDVKPKDIIEFYIKKEKPRTEL